MSKFLDTQFSVTGIKDFDISTSYIKYDLVDYQYYTGDGLYPTNVSGMFAWFNIDNLNNFTFDSSGKIYAWFNSSPGHSEQNLYNSGSVESRPYYNSNKNSVTCEADSDLYTYNQLLTNSDYPNFSGFLGADRCWFIVYEFDSLRKGDKTTPIGYYANYSTIINTDEKNASSASTGYLGVYGNNIDNSLNSNVLAGSQEFIIIGDDPANIYPNATTLNNSFSSANLLKKNIISIIKNNTTNNLTIRNNGYEVLNTTTNYFASGCASLRIGTAKNAHGPVPSGAGYNYDASNISYYEILGYSLKPSNEEIIQIEKYLFKKHFTNDDNLYIASQNFTTSDYRYSPINLLGSQYLTKNIDSLFSKTYGCSANFSTKAIRANYGDGYYINVIPNINNLKSNFALSYNGLTDKQANCLIGFFQNTFEYEPLTDTSPYQNVEMDLFYPYKNNAKIYFENLDFKSVEANINNLTIQCSTAYDSSLDYKGYLITDETTTRFFNQNKQYYTHDIVYYNLLGSYQGYYWYTGQNGSFINETQSPTGANSLFTKNFYFKTDLDFSIPLQPRFLKNEYEMTSVSYEQDGINKNILNLNLSFNNRSDKETIAILKFLDSQCGFKLFEFTLPEPYNKNITVYCPEWNHSYKFKDNHDISVKFLEFKGLTKSDIYFNTLLKL